MFLAPFYLPQPLDWRFTLIPPAILVLAIFVLSLSWKTWAAILLVAAYWELQRHVNARYQLVMTGVMQLLVGLLLLR